MGRPAVRRYVGALMDQRDERPVQRARRGNRPRRRRPLRRHGPTARRRRDVRDGRRRANGRRADAQAGRDYRDGDGRDMSSRAYPELVRVPPRRPMPRDLPAPPADLAPATFAGRLYDMLEPLAEQDPQAGWSLLILCNAIGTAYQLVEDLVRDTAAGPGWSSLMDVARCPYDALPWLAQFAGVRIPPSVVAD